MLYFWIFFSFFAHASSSVSVGERFYLKKQKSYHFSSGDLIEPHVSAPQPFVVGLKAGHLTYEEQGQVKNLFILNPGQKFFFDQVNFLVTSSPFLDWTYTEKNLVLRGKALGPAEFKFLVQHCVLAKNSQIKIILEKDFFLPQSQEERSCLRESYHNDIKILSLAFISKNSQKRKRAGIGGPISLDWQLDEHLTPIGQNYGGQAALGKNSSQSKGDFILSGQISPSSPIDFEKGLEVGVQSGSLFSRKNLEWKRASTQITAELKKLKSRSAQILLSIKDQSRTGEKNVFQSNKIQKTLVLEYGVWLKFLSFQQNNRDKSKGGFLGSSVLGQKSKGQSQEQIEVWVRLDHDQI